MRRLGLPLGLCMAAVLAACDLPGVTGTSALPRPALPEEAVLSVRPSPDATEVVWESQDGTPLDRTLVLASGFGVSAEDPRCSRLLRAVVPGEGRLFRVLCRTGSAPAHRLRFRGRVNVLRADSYLGGEPVYGTYRRGEE